VLDNFRNFLVPDPQWGNTTWKKKHNKACWLSVILVGLEVTVVSSLSDLQPATDDELARYGGFAVEIAVSCAHTHTHTHTCKKPHTHTRTHTRTETEPGCEAKRNHD
jgi:hypothetical protein